MADPKQNPPGEEDLKKSVIEQFDALDKEDKLKVLGFARELAARHRRGIPEKGGALLAYAGSIPKEDLAEMRRAIEEGCEKVDEETW